MEKTYPIPVWTISNSKEILITIDKKPAGSKSFPYGIVLWDPERLFNGQLYSSWVDMMKKINQSNSIPPIESHSEIVQQFLNIEGPIENIRLSWYWDRNNSQIGGYNAILLRFNLTDTVIKIKIHQK